MWNDPVYRLRASFGRRAVEAELDEELPELGVVPGADTKVEKLPVKKAAARRRPTPAKKPAPSGEPRAEAEED